MRKTDINKIDCSVLVTGYFAKYIFFPCSKKRLRFLYGKWTESIKCCSSAAYEQWAKENGESSSQTPSHTPKKVLAKLNSFKVGALRSMSIQDVSNSILGDFKILRLLKKLSPFPKDIHK